MTEANPKKVMLADDEENVLELVSAALTRKPTYQLIVARDGEEAMRVAHERLPDLLLLDVSMPKYGGLEVCKALKEDPDTSHIKIVMLSALAQEGDRQRALEAGADGYITKPFSPAALLAKIEDYLGQSDLLN